MEVDWYILILQVINSFFLFVLPIDFFSYSCFRMRPGCMRKYLGLVYLTTAVGGVHDISE